MGKIIVAVADMKLSDNPEEEIITYSLGSCLGLTIYDPKAKVGGMVHAILPDSRVQHRKVIENPYKFINTGVPLLFKSAYKLGAKKSRIIVKAAGCGRVLNDSNLFNIGKRNEAAIRKLLWKNNVLLKKSDFGSNKSRTITLNLKTGGLTVRVGRKTSITL